MQMMIMENKHNQRLCLNNLSAKHSSRILLSKQLQGKNFYFFTIFINFARHIVRTFEEIRKYCQGPKMVQIAHVEMKKWK